MGEKLATILGKPVVVDNKHGGNGSIATDAIARATPDGRHLASLPEVPTFAEPGIEDMVISNWFGVVAPKGTPPAVVAKLNQAINQALQAPDLARRITDPGNVIGAGTPEDFAALIASESQRWGQLIKARGIRPD
ncbi:hypothetical protein HHL10_19435 [Azohydromonas sp. G-1-1-14]|uniref:Tripartite tricarboxylate transporter family receptor n=1 Tax=Azohydromonas caseinilytica TaxID=2728836 RepID=A0A848FH30_9BURK|nr:hypothetical protein [Azohydromonas caseinilytica]